METNTNCEGRTKDGSFRGGHCPHLATLEEEGHHFCSLHAPSKVEARRAARLSAQQSERARINKAQAKISQGNEDWMTEIRFLLPELTISDLTSEYRDHGLTGSIVLSLRAQTALLEALRSRS